MTTIRLKKDDACLILHADGRHELYTPGKFGEAPVNVQLIVAIGMALADETWRETMIAMLDRFISESKAH